MFLGRYCLSLFLLVSLGVELAYANHPQQEEHQHQLHHLYRYGDHHGYPGIHLKPIERAASHYQTVFVDPSGHGNFSTIQSAIDSVPSNNKYWVSVQVKAGTYREKLTIPYDKPYIVLKGEGKTRTFVEWQDHSSIVQSPTFSTMADNVVVKSISFKNLYNNDKNALNMLPAVAAMVSGDKSYFYDVGFYGLQDTLWDDRGRHYFRFCFISGAMDFIFGSGQSLYERCTISVNGAALGPGIRGYITAQGRDNSKDTNGFVFKSCNIIGNGTTFLGRPWRVYARVLFYNTMMTDIILPQGWEPWDYTNNVGLITFSEYGNYGPGANTSQRVSWMKKLDSSTINMLTSTSFIDTEGWIKTQQQF
ncbi:hypothetical protein Fmac_001811 [Flemingia macrophylla]|uniref:pectinesterase n=1 Tax=Flemingia macrophylla TaxID=520843 RepID=A0ABD1NIA9_9FABA